MKPRARSECIVPAASTAVLPAFNVHALTSSAPDVKNEINPNNLYAS